jgi:hypothetical protein
MAISIKYVLYSHFSHKEKDDYNTWHNNQPSEVGNLGSSELSMLN